MLLGAHVSPAGGPANALDRGEELGCAAIQIFNQSPRMWKGRVYSDEEVAAYRERSAAVAVGTVRCGSLEERSEPIWGSLHSGVSGGRR